MICNNNLSTCPPHYFRMLSCFLNFVQSWLSTSWNSHTLLDSFPQYTPKRDIWIHLLLMPSSDITTLTSQLWMMQFHNLIFQTAHLIVIGLSIQPQSGYLLVWNAVCFIYSNPDESSHEHDWRWHFGYNMDSGPFQFLSVLPSIKNAHWMMQASKAKQLEATMAQSVEK